MNQKLTFSNLSTYGAIAMGVEIGWTEDIK